MSLESKIFSLVLGLAFVGGLGMYVHARKQLKGTQKKLWVKYVIYLLIITVVLGSSFYLRSVYISLFVLVSIIGGYEIHHIAPNQKVKAAALILYFVIAMGFLHFIMAPKGGIDGCIVYTTILIFDAFSQVTGQLVGRTKITPRLSPNKTGEGVLGGTIVAVPSYLYLTNGTQLSLVFVIVSGAFAGDLLASYYKRVCGVKDFSQLIPGHGGILDRFDSYIFSGFVLSLYTQIQLPYEIL
jgi:phosphatidate cytidylyltransferase